MNVKQLSRRAATVLRRNFGRYVSSDQVKSRQVSWTRTEALDWMQYFSEDSDVVVLQDRYLGKVTRYCNF